MASGKNDGVENDRQAVTFLNKGRKSLSALLGEGRLKKMSSKFSSR